MAPKMEHHNLDPNPEGLPAGAPRDAILAEFGSRLQKRMAANGWDQTELAKQISLKLPKGGKPKKVTRSSTSLYVRGKNLPRPAVITAICKALECDKEDLIPMGVPSVDGEIELSAVGDGMYWLKISQAVPLGVASQIMALLDQQ